MNIEGPMANENHRMRGMTEEDRRWRKQWFQDQELTAREPVEVPELRRVLVNPIKRFYKYPMDRFQKFLEPRFGQSGAMGIRYSTTMFAAIIFATYWSAYYLKYNQKDWTRKFGWEVTSNRPIVLPGDPRYPMVSDRTKPSDYSNQGFNQRKVFLD